MEQVQIHPGRPARLGPVTKALYGLGTAHYGARAAMASLTLFYYNQVVGLPAPLISLAMGSTLFLDAFCDPLIGLFSDRLRTPWGRRHPLMYLAPVPFVVCWLLLWRPPAGLSEWGTFGWLVTMLILMRTIVSVYEVPGHALGPELAADYHERTSMMAVRAVVQVGGGVLATSLGYFYFFRPTPGYPVGQLNPAAWAPLTLSVAAMMLTTMLVSAIGTHHRIPTLHKPPPRRLGMAATLRDVISTVRNWNFGVALVAAMFGGMAAGLHVGLDIYIDTFVWGLPALGVGILMLIRFAAALLAGFAIPALSRRIGKRSAYMTVTAIAVLAAGAPLVLRLLGLFPPNGTDHLFHLLMGFRLVSGLCTVGTSILVASMTADITDDVQAKTGKRAEGLLMSADNLLQQLTTAMSSLLPGLILAAVGFPKLASPGLVAPDVLRNLILIYLPITAGLSVASMGIWSLFRIDQATHERNLSARQAAAVVAERSEVDIA